MYACVCVCLHIFMYISVVTIRRCTTCVFLYAKRAAKRNKNDDDDEEEEENSGAAFFFPSSLFAFDKITASVHTHRVCMWVLSTVRAVRRTYRIGNRIQNICIFRSRERDRYSEWDFFFLSCQRICVWYMPMQSTENAQNNAMAKMIKIIFLLGVCALHSYRRLLNCLLFIFQQFVHTSHSTAHFFLCRGRASFFAKIKKKKKDTL